MSDAISTLTMKFRTADDRKKSVNIQPCGAGVSAQVVKDLMDAMIESDALLYQPAQKLGALITVRSTTELF